MHSMAQISQNMKQFTRPVNSSRISLVFDAICEGYLKGNSQHETPGPGGEVGMMRT